MNSPEPVYLSPPVPLLEDLAWHAPSVCLLILGADGLILRANEAAQSALGVPPTGGFVWDILSDGGASVLRVLMQEARIAPVRRILLNFSDRVTLALTLTCSIGWTGEEYVLFGERQVKGDEQMKQELLALTRELTERNRACTKIAAELKTTLAELQKSHWQIRKIQEFLPACCACDKVRPAPGEEETAWLSLSSFLAANGLLMSHGYCPECEAKAMADIDAEVPPHG